MTRSIAAAAVSALAHAYPSTRAGRLLILIYHRVRPCRDPMFPGEVDACRFDWQLSLLRRYCRPIELRDAVRGLRDDSLPPRSVAVTFDDGYADNVTVALPILQRHGIPATFFIAPGFLDGGRMWNDSIIEAVRRAPGESLDLTNFGQGVVPLGPEAARGRIAESIIGAVKRLAPQIRLDHVNQLCRRIGIDLPVDLMLTTDQVRLLANAGQEIGAHTMTHPILRTLSDDVARAEIQLSREALERITGRPVRAFAFPNGRPGDDYTARDCDLVRDLGFEFALSTRPGAASSRSDVYQLPRFTPWDQEPWRWLMRLLWMFGNSGPATGTTSLTTGRCP